MNSKKTLILLSVLILGLSFTLAVLLYKKSQKDQTQQIAQTQSDVFVRDYSVRMGPPEAKVTLVEFMDPECESCREFAPLVKSIMKDYEGKIQLVIRYAAFHPNAPMMVKILEASRNQGKYWEVLDTLFKYQPQWGDHHNPNPDLVWKYLPEAGVDIEKIKAEMNNPEFQKIIDTDMEDVKKLGVRYTPTFYVNGKILDDYGYEPLKALVESELNK